MLGFCKHQRGSYIMLINENKADHLGKILNFTAQTVPYYSDLKECDNICYEEFPYISRHDLQLRHEDFISNIYSGNINTMLKKYSSGSSGEPLCTIWRPSDYLASMHTLWKRRISYYNIYPHTPRIDFVFESLDEKKWYNKHKSGISFSRTILHDDDKMSMMYNIWQESSVEWLYVQPYVAKCIALYIINNNLTVPKKLRYIEFVGEILSDQTRKLVEGVFKCKTANLYGSEEINGIAYECPYHRLHILNDNVYMEYEESTGKIFLTSLHNHCMPIIKYEQGDIVEVEHQVSQCRCGSVEPIISRIYGRSYESLTCDVNPYILITIIEKVNTQVGGFIYDYHYQYKKINNEMTVFINEIENQYVRMEIIQRIIGELVRLNFSICPAGIVFQKTNSTGKKKNSILEIL